MEEQLNDVLLQILPGIGLWSEPNNDSHDEASSSELPAYDANVSAAEVSTAANCAARVKGSRAIAGAPG